MLSECIAGKEDVLLQCSAGKEDVLESVMLIKLLSANWIDLLFTQGQKARRTDGTIRRRGKTVGKTSGTKGITG